MEPIAPNPHDTRPERWPLGAPTPAPVLVVHGGVGLGVVTHAHVRIQPYPARAREGVVGMDEAAFGGFEVVGCEGVWDAAEAEGGGGVKWSGVESDCWGKRGYW